MNFNFVAKDKRRDPNYFKSITIILTAF